VSEQAGTPLKLVKKKKIDLSHAIQEKVQELSSEDRVLNTDYGITMENILQISDGGEFALSRFMCKHLSGLYCYDTSSRKMRRFNGSVWVDDEKNEIFSDFKRLQRALLEALDAADNLTEEGSKFIRKTLLALNRGAGLSSLAALVASGSDGLGVPGEIFDADPRYVGAPNGVIDLRTGQLLDADPGKYITKVVGCEYNQDAKIPTLFLNTLAEIFKYPYLKPDKDEFGAEIRDQVDPIDLSVYSEEEQRVHKKKQEAAHEANLENEKRFWVKNQEQARELIAFLQRLIGYSLLGTGEEHIFIVLLGIGRNGKGIFVRSALRVLGDYAGEVRPEILIKNYHSRQSSSPTPEILDLKGQRLVVASETNQGEFFDTGQVKRLTGGDTLVGRALYGRKEVRFKPTHTIGLQTNFPPNAPAEDIAFWDRLILIPFNRRFVTEPDPDNPYEAVIDKKLEDKLMSESESILKWIVDGAIAYQEEGLNPPACIRDAVETYKSKGDYFADFIDECCVTGEYCKERTSEFVQCFNEWRKAQGMNRTLSAKVIAERLERRGFPKKKTGGHHYFMNINLDAGAHEYRNKD